GTDQNETRRVGNRNSFTFDYISTRCCRIKQHINKMVIKKVHFIDVQKSAICACKQPGFKSLYCFDKGPFNINRAADPVFRCAQRQINNGHHAGFGEETALLRKPVCALNTEFVYALRITAVQTSLHHSYSAN